MPTRLLRLNRLLAEAGLTSRRKADQWIQAGRVAVNGRTVSEPGLRVYWPRDRVTVDGREVRLPDRFLYLMLNKPFGVVCSLHDPQGRPVVRDLLEGVQARVYPVGRLDFDSLGLLLLTNDGEWAYRLTHPRYRVPRTYKVTVSGRVSREVLEGLQRGIRLEDGVQCRAGAALIGGSRHQTILRLTLTQGLRRQVRRMLEAVGFPVIHLIRTGFGPLTLGELKVGAYRHLTEEEVLSLKKMVGLS